LASWLTLLIATDRRATSRALPSAGSSSASSSAMIATTTSNSISVKPREGRRGGITIMCLCIMQSV